MFSWAPFSWHYEILIGVLFQNSYRLFAKGGHVGTDEVERAIRRGIGEERCESGRDLITALFRHWGKVHGECDYLVETA
jgi:hypothetical protein